MIIPRKIYYRVAAALFVLLGLTIGAALMDLGPFNVVLALTIAIVKATLVVLYFMHVRYATRLTWIFAAGGFLWFILMIVLTMSDYLTR